MLQIKQKGLNISFCSLTGKCFLTYYYPIKREYIERFSSIVSTYNSEIVTIKNKTYILFKSLGNSEEVISSFRAVQREFMLHSREFKIESLESEIVFLKRK